MRELSETGPEIRETTAPASTPRAPGGTAPLVVLTFVTAIWAVNFLAAKRAVDEIPPVPFTTVRVVLGGLFFLAVCGEKGLAVVFRRDTLRAVLPLSLLGIVANQLLFIEGLKRTTPTHSAIVVALIPVCVALLAHRFLRERIGPVRLAGIIAAFAGVAVVEFGAGGGPIEARHLPGDALTLLAVFAFSGYTVLAKRLMPRFGPVVTMAGCYLVAMAILVPASLPYAFTHDWRQVSTAACVDLGYVVLFATIVAYLGHSWALSQIDSSRVAVFTCAQPVLAGFCSWMWLHEAVTPSLSAGGILALVGVALVQIG